MIIMMMSLKLCLTLCVSNLTSLTATIAVLVCLHAISSVMSQCLIIKVAVFQGHVKSSVGTGAMLKKEPSPPSMMGLRQKFAT